MKVDRPIPASTITELRGTPLKQGQVLAAIVLQSSNAKGEALLSLAGGQLSVQTRLPLQAGAALKLTVSDLGPPLVLQLAQTGGAPAGAKSSQDLQTRLLTLLFQRTNQPTTPTVPTSSTAPTAAPATSLAGTTTPMQQQTTASPAALANLVAGSAVAKEPALLLSALPAAVRAALPQLDAPPLAAIMATTLTKLVATLSLPVQVARPGGRDTSAPDLKTQLKVAAQAIKSSLNTPTSAAPTGDARSAAPAHTAQVLNTLSDWVSRMDISQLRTALQQVQGQASWLIDVPVVIAEQPRRLQLTVSQEDEANAQAGDSAGWQLDFALDLPELGPLHGSLHLKTSDLTVRLYADEPEARQRLNQSLDQLATQLRRAELNPKELNVYPGPPPKAVLARLTPAPQRPEGPSQYSWRA